MRSLICYSVPNIQRACCLAKECRTNHTHSDVRVAQRVFPPRRGWPFLSEPQEFSKFPTESRRDTHPLSTGLAWPRGRFLPGPGPVLLHIAARPFPRPSLNSAGAPLRPVSPQTFPRASSPKHSGHGPISLWNSADPAAIRHHRAPRGSFSRRPPRHHVRFHSLHPVCFHLRTAPSGARRGVHVSHPCHQEHPP